MMAGPAVGGILIGAIGLTGTYSVDAATYALAFAAFTTISPSPPVGAAHGASVASVLHGLRFLRGQPVVVSVFGIDLITMVFGMPIAPSPR